MLRASKTEKLLPKIQNTGLDDLRDFPYLVFVFFIAEATFQSRYFDDFIQRRQSIVRRYDFQR